jgi:hypothetical protein
MACFIAPAGVALVTTVVRKIVEKRENDPSGRGAERRPDKMPGKWTQRLGWLNTMLWGGVVMLVLEHVVNGELVPWPPFLTAMQTPEGAGAALREIAVIGGGMTAAVFVVWAVMVLVAELKSRAKRVSEV